MVFGIMEQSTGKCWPSIGLWYRDDLNQYLYRAVNIDRIAVPKDYINVRIIRLQEDESNYEVL